MFSSPWWLPGGHLQTIYASLRPPPRVPLERSRWQTADGDFVDVDFAGDAKAPRRLALFHGLEGCSDSHYARAIAAHAVSRGWRVAIPHWRGCSGEPNRRPRAYHSGDSEEEAPSRQPRRTRKKEERRRGRSCSRRAGRTAPVDTRAGRAQAGAEAGAYATANGDASSAAS